MEGKYDQMTIWGLRFMRGILLALAASIFAYVQNYAPLPVLWIGLALCLMSIVDGLRRHMFAAVAVLMTMAIIPPSLPSAVGAWVLALVK